MEPPAGRRDVQQHGARIHRVGGAAHVTLALKGRNHATRRTFVEGQTSSKRLECGRPATNQSLECIALTERDVMAADTVTLTDEVGADEIRQRLVEGLALPLKERSIRGPHICY